MWAKIWALCVKHPQTGVSALGSVLAGTAVILPSVLTVSAKAMAGIMFVFSFANLLLAQLKPILDKLFPSDAP